MTAEYVWVCRECHALLERVEIDANYVEYHCPTHGRQGFVYRADEGELDFGTEEQAE